MTEPSADSLPDDPAAAKASTADGADLARRRFFRQFAGEVVRGAATVTGAAGAIQRSLGEAAWATLDPSSLEGERPTPQPGSTTQAAIPAAAFRLDGDRVLVVDQRRLPDAVVEFPIATSADGVRAIRESMIRGAPATSQIAALCMALTARSIGDMKAAYAREATLRFSADALISAHVASAAVRWVVNRCLGLANEIGSTAEDGLAGAEALWAEALRLIAEAASDHDRLAGFGVDALPAPQDRPLHVLTHSSSGWLAGGQVGTALGIVDIASRRGQHIHVFVAESRPDLEGTRLAAWELAQAGVPHTIVGDGAVGWLLAGGVEIDAVLVGAEMVAANGDTVARVGTYPLAVLAARHGVPFYVCTPLCSVDTEMADGTFATIEQRPGGEVINIRGVLAAPPRSIAINPASDMTPASLIAGIVTEVGVLRPDFVVALETAVASRDARWADRHSWLPGPPADATDATPTD